MCDPRDLIEMGGDDQQGAFLVADLLWLVTLLRTRSRPAQILKCLSPIRRMRAPTAPAAPVTMPFVIVVPCSLPNSLAAFMMGLAAVPNPSRNGPLLVEASKVPLAIPAVIATGDTTTMLTFAQKSFEFSTCCSSRLRRCSGGPHVPARTARAACVGGVSGQARVRLSTIMARAERIRHGR